LEDDFFFDTGIKKANTGKPELDPTYRMQLTLWESLKTSQQAGEIIEYLKLFPSGYFSEFAQFRLDQLTRPSVLAMAKPGDKLANNSLTTRAYVGSVKEMQFENRDSSRYAKFVNRSEVVKIDETGIYWRDQFDNWGKPTDVLGSMDLMGNPLSGAGITRSVPIQIVPSEYKVGYRWKYSDRSISEIGATSSDYEARIVGKEIVKTKIGDIEAFRIETKRWRSDGATENSTRWVVPGELGTVKHSRKLYSKGGQAYISESEIVSFKSGKPS
jgi:hypothetical protein